MHTIYGNPIPDGRIDFRGARLIHQAAHPWPEDTAVSAGRGVVFRRGTNEHYTTLFMEVYPPGASFIRGEGPTPQACEDSCWAQYQVALHCRDGHTHEWEPYRTRADGSPGSRYTNGAGFCVHCSTFRSEVFTGEQLGQFCGTCGAGTTWTCTEEGVWLCKDHAPPPATDAWLGDLLGG